MRFDIEDTKVVKRVELFDIQAVVLFTGWRTSQGLLFHLRTPIPAESIYRSSKEEAIQYIALVSRDFLEPLVPILTCSLYVVEVNIPAVETDPFIGPYEYLAKGVLRLTRAERGFDTRGLKELTIKLIK